MRHQKGVVTNGVTEILEFPTGRILGKVPQRGRSKVTDKSADEGIYIPSFLHLGMGCTIADDLRMLDDLEEFLGIG